MIRIVKSGCVIAALIAVSAVDARAQMSMGSFYGYLTGHLGGNVAGDTDNPRINAGASVAVQETTGWGAEFDFGRSTDLDIGNQAIDLNTYMVNMSFVRPAKQLRPFVIAGGGVHQATGCACRQSATTYDFALNAGGGVYLLANDMFGMRADARYFWSAGDHPELRRPDHLAYWRLTVGVTYLWSIAP